MLNRWSVNFLLKSVITVMAAAIVAMLATGAWSAYQRFSSASQMSVLTDASRSVFLALNNLRLDRAFSDRALKADTPAANDLKQVSHARAAEMPALKAALRTLSGADFPGHDATVANLGQAIAKLESLQSASAAAFDEPKSARPASLAGELFSFETELIDTLDQLDGQLAAEVKLKDPLVDEMLTVKQLGWAARSAAGDASKTLSDSMIAGKASPEQQATYARAIVEIPTSWHALQLLLSGTNVPANLAAAIAKANSVYFTSEMTGLRDQMFKQVLAGQKPDLPVTGWTSRSVPAIQTVLDVVIAAINAAHDRTEALRSSAITDVAIQLGLLALALVLGVGSFLAVGSRVIRPLLGIRDRMVKLAGGDLSVDVAFTERQDEIGALAGTLATFKENAAAKARIEDEQKGRHAEAAARQEGLEAAIRSFESEIGSALDALNSASGQMRSASDDISSTVSTSDRQVQTVVGAAVEASKNVQSVAASTEQLGASSTEISGQVTRAASIASRAVEEARQTDSTIQGLVGATSRIGEVVELITSIAGQTNLLALNATIEAARAGEAGKGFAVVASEVKSLANQTAKATEDISAQIIAVQNVTKEAVEAIQRIGATIADVSAVATSIASAVEEQTNATQEIKRSTQEAARRTQEVSDNMTDVASGSERTGSAAGAVNSSVKTLTSEADHLRAQITAFLGKMRAA
jgi:methyl-accepting chemotaxis protein